MVEDATRSARHGLSLIVSGVFPVSFLFQARVGQEVSWNEAYFYILSSSIISIPKKFPYDRSYYDKIQVEAAISTSMSSCDLDSVLH